MNTALQAQAQAHAQRQMEAASRQQQLAAAVAASGGVSTIPPLASAVFPTNGSQAIALAQLANEQRARQALFYQQGNFDQALQMEHAAALQQQQQQVNYDILIPFSRFQLIFNLLPLMFHLIAFLNSGSLCIF